MSERKAITYAELAEVGGVQPWTVEPKDITFDVIQATVFVGCIIKRPSGCWLHSWPGKDLHRMSYRIFRGPLVRKRVYRICATNDSEWCINPDHLLNATIAPPPPATIMAYREDGTATEVPNIAIEGERLYREATAKRRKKKPGTPKSMTSARKAATDAQRTMSPEQVAEIRRLFNVERLTMGKIKERLGLESSITTIRAIARRERYLDLPSPPIRARYLGYGIRELQDETVTKARELYHAGMTRREVIRLVAPELGLVNSGTFNSMVWGKTYREIPMPAVLRQKRVTASYTHRK